MRQSGSSVLRMIGEPVYAGDVILRQSGDEWRKEGSGAGREGRWMRLLRLMTRQLCQRCLDRCERVRVGDLCGSERFCAEYRQLPHDCRSITVCRVNASRVNMSRMALSTALPSGTAAAARWGAYAIGAGAAVSRC